MQGTQICKLETPREPRRAKARRGCAQGTQTDLKPELRVQAAPSTPQVQHVRRRPTQARHLGRCRKQAGGVTAKHSTAQASCGIGRRHDKIGHTVAPMPDGRGTAFTALAVSEDSAKACYKAMSFWHLTPIGTFQGWNWVMPHRQPLQQNKKPSTLRPKPKSLDPSPRS